MRVAVLEVAHLGLEVVRALHIQVHVAAPAPCGLVVVGEKLGLGRTVIPRQLAPHREAGSVAFEPFCLHAVHDGRLVHVHTI